MILGKLFKKKEKKEELKPEKPAAKLTAVKEVKMKPVSGQAKILLSPHITEKTGILAKRNQYVFKVLPQANKTEIKKAVEQLYKVKVVGLNIINIPAKKKRLGRSQGWKKGYKKAIVSLKPGQKIEIA